MREEAVPFAVQGEQTVIAGRVPLSRRRCRREDREIGIERSLETRGCRRCSVEQEDSWFPERANCRRSLGSPAKRKFRNVAGDSAIRRINSIGYRFLGPGVYPGPERKRGQLQITGGGRVETSRRILQRPRVRLTTARARFSHYRFRLLIPPCR